MPSQRLHSPLYVRPFLINRPTGWRSLLPLTHCPHLMAVANSWALVARQSRDKRHISHCSNAIFLMMAVPRLKQSPGGRGRWGACHLAISSADGRKVFRCHHSLSFNNGHSSVDTSQNSQRMSYSSSVETSQHWTMTIFIDKEVAVRTRSEGQVTRPTRSFNENPALLPENGISSLPLPRPCPSSAGSQVSFVRS